MPKIVDHAKRRDEIALVACQVVADQGFERTTVARIAAAAGYTTGMVAHYYESKQDIILAALRLILKRIEERLTRERDAGGANLLSVLSEALPIDEQRFTECAFWMAFWGQVSADPKLKRLNAWVHREYMRLFARCFAEYWPQWQTRTPEVRDQVRALGGHLHERHHGRCSDQSAGLARPKADRAPRPAIDAPAPLGAAESRRRGRGPRGSRLTPGRFAWISR